MHKLFFPKSIVVFGVSAELKNLAKYIVMNLDLFKYTGRVYCIGRENGEVFGRKIYQSVAQLGGAPELAVFLIPAKGVPESLDSCGRAGITHAVIESGGFSEFADESRSMEKNLLASAASHGMRFMGPNCISIINLENGMALPFVPLDPSKMRKGAVSVLAQSGGVVVDFTRLFEIENIGFSKMVSMGNKLDLNECDFLEYLIDDQDTKIIVIHLESVSGGERLMDIAATTKKPIIMIKANRSPAGQEIAHFHTAALAGDDEVADAAFRQAGIHRVANLQEAADCVKTFSLPPIKGPNLGILCRSGGQAVILADAAWKYGFERADFSSDFFTYVRKECRAGVIRPTNPLDLGDIFDFDAYSKILERVLLEKTVDGVVLYHGYLGAFERETTKKLIHTCHELSWKYNKPVLFFMIPDAENWFEFKRMTDLPVFCEPDNALKALARSLEHSRRASDGRKRRFSYVARPRAGAVETAVSALPAAEVYSILESIGLPVIAWALVENMVQARKKAKELGYPVALKMASAEVIHKTERKGVVLNINGPKELENKFSAMLELQGGGSLLLQKMAPVGRELILGGKRDKEFGPLVMVGTGGMLVEVMKDVSMRLAPVTIKQAREMINEMKGSRILGKFRAMPQADLEALSAYIQKLSKMIVEKPWIKSIDINPLILLCKREGGLIVDAKIEAWRSPEKPYRS